jgi:hypothetical protein
MPLTIQLNRPIHAPPNPQFDECRREAFETAARRARGSDDAARMHEEYDLAPAACSGETTVRRFQSPVET